MNYNRKFHSWYDSLQEPYRLLGCLILVSPGMLLVSLDTTIPWRLFGLFLLFAVGFSRWYYLVTSEKKDGQETVQ
jgi:hypothetical protein